MKKKIREMAENQGMICGVAPKERLGRKPSMDVNYVLPGANSVISMAHPLDGEVIRRYLGKVDYEGYLHHECMVYTKLYSTANKIADFLKSEGYRAVVVLPNGDYRYKQSVSSGQNVPLRIPPGIIQSLFEWFTNQSGPLVSTVKKGIIKLLYKPAFGSVDWMLTPTFSHRYGAVAAGLGVIGWSGNLMTPEYGSRVLLESVITDAVLEPDRMLEESPCDGCRICSRVCQAGYINIKEKERVNVGEKTFAHNKKGSNIRCSIVCAGLSGQSKFSGWSTWSPGRITLPETDVNIQKFWDTLVMDNLWQDNWYSKTLKNLALAHDQAFMDEQAKYRVKATCGNCQLVCWKTRKEREYNYELLTTSGEVIQDQGLGFKVVRP